MNPFSIRVILVTLLISGCGPDDRPHQNQNQNPDSHGPYTELSDCLLAGGELVIAETRELDAVDISALAISSDGSILTGEDLGAVNHLFRGFDVETRAFDPDIHQEMNLLLPAGGQKITTLAFSADGSTAVAGDENGQLGLVTLSETGAGDIRFWGSVSEAAIQTVTASTDGATVAWLDASYTGQPRLWSDVVFAGTPPEPLQTHLWNGHATGWLRNGSLWMIAGDWYGIPLIEIRLTADPTATIESWFLRPEEFSGSGGTITALLPVLDETQLFVAGHREFEDHGFIALVEISEIDETARIDSLSEPGLSTLGLLKLEEHRPHQAHILAGDKVALTLGEASDLIAWDLESLTALSTATFEGLLSTAIDPDGQTLIGGTLSGELTLFACQR